MAVELEKAQSLLSGRFPHIKSSFILQKIRKYPNRVSLPHDI